MKTNESYNECLKILKNHHYKHYKIDYILQMKQSNNLHFIGYATSKENSEDMVYIKFKDKSMSEVYSIPDWDFNVDGYLLSELEQGYTIDYMSLECHYNTWCNINEWRDELEHSDGLQKYLSYCQKNDINSNIIGIYSNNHINIMDMYKENNAGFDIIASTSIGSHSIVLGYNRRKDEYVTWRTSPNRNGGYDIGYYYSNYKDAFKNYEGRCNDILEKHLSFEKNKTKPKEKSFER